MQPAGEKGWFMQHLGRLGKEEICFRERKDECTSLTLASVDVCQLYSLICFQVCLFKVFAGNNDCILWWG